MAERYAKARMFHQDEAKDSKVRALVRHFDDREEAFGAIILYHRIIPRLDVRGAILYDPAWLYSECFLGYPVTIDEVTRWADALLEVRGPDGNPLLEAYEDDGIRYAWARSFYRNNPRLQYQYEDPRVPCPPGFEFEDLIPDDRPGPRPSAPAWARETTKRAVEKVGPALVDDEDEAPLGGVPVIGKVSRRIAGVEVEWGEDLAVAVRRYARHFETHQEAIDEGAIRSATLTKVVSALDMWRQDGGVQFRGRIAWDPDRVRLAVEDVSRRVFDTPLKSHTYVLELLADEKWPPKEGSKPANAPARVERPSDVDDYGERERKTQADREARIEEEAKALEAWEVKVEAWIEDADEDVVAAIEAEAASKVENVKKFPEMHRKALRAAKIEAAAARAEIPRPGKVA